MTKPEFARRSIHTWLVLLDKHKPFCFWMILEGAFLPPRTTSFSSAFFEHPSTRSVLSLSSWQPIDHLEVLPSRTNWTHWFARFVWSLPRSPKWFYSHVKATFGRPKKAHSYYAAPENTSIAENSHKIPPCFLLTVSWSLKDMCFLQETQCDWPHIAVAF